MSVFGLNVNAVVRKDAPRISSQLAAHDTVQRIGCRGGADDNADDSKTKHDVVVAKG